MSKTELAKELGLSIETLHQWSNNDRIPAVLIKLGLFCEKYNISLDWLLLNRGEMLYDESAPRVSAEAWQDILKHLEQDPVLRLERTIRKMIPGLRDKE